MGQNVSLGIENIEASILIDIIDIHRHMYWVQFALYCQDQPKSHREWERSTGREKTMVLDYPVR